MPHLGREESSFKNRGFVYFWFDIKTPWEYVVQNIFENDCLKRKISVFFFRKSTADVMGREASGKWCLYTMRLTNTCFFGSLEMVYILRTSQHIYHLKWTMTTLEMLRSKIVACFHITLPRRDTLSWKQKRHVNNYLLLSQYLVEMKTSQTRSVGYLRYPKVCKNPENFSVRLYR